MFNSRGACGSNLILNRDLVEAPGADAMHADPVAALDALKLAAGCYTRYIALCCPAPRKPGVYLPTNPRHPHSKLVRETTFSSS
jgi:hypothetical protein